MIKVFVKKILCVFIIIVSLFPLFILDVKGDFSNSTHFNSSKYNNLSFEELDFDLSVLPEIDYTSLNDIWYNPKIEMLIITPYNTAFMNAVEPLLDWNVYEEHNITWRLFKDAGINWLIIGAQTKPTVYPRIEWIQETVEAADKAGIPVFLKNNLKPILTDNWPNQPWAFTDGYYTDDEHPNIDRHLRQEMPKI